MKAFTRSLAVASMVLFASSAFAISVGAKDGGETAGTIPALPSQMDESASLVLLSGGAFAAAGLIRRRK